VGIARAEIGQVGNHSDVVLVSLQRCHALGQTDVGKATGLGWKKGVGGESESAADEEHAFRIACRRLRTAKCVEHGNGKGGGACLEEGAAIMDVYTHDLSLVRFLTSFRVA